MMRHPHNKVQHPLNIAPPEEVHQQAANRTRARATPWKAARGSHTVHIGGMEYQDREISPVNPTMRLNNQLPKKVGYKRPSEREQGATQLYKTDGQRTPAVQKYDGQEPGSPHRALEETGHQETPGSEPHRGQGSPGQGDLECQPNDAPQQSAP